MTIDGFRIIAAILIIFIHTSMLNTNNYVEYNIPLYVIASTISRYCVPIFMMITGYFYYSNPTVSRKKRILKKLFLLWTIWMIIYSPIGLKSINEFSVIYLLKFFIKQIVFSSNFFWGSWYLTATMFGIVFVDFCRKIGKMTICIILAVILSLIDSISSYYYFLFKPYSLILGYPGNFSMSLFTGIIWITLAYYIAKFDKNLALFGKPIYSFIAIIITFIEFYIMTKIEPFPDYKNPGALQSPLTLPLSVFLIFMFVINHKYYLEKSKVIWVRNLSTLIFFVQFGVIDLINLCRRSNFMNINIYNYTFFVLGITVFISILIYLLSLSVKLKMLRYLY